MSTIICRANTFFDSENMTNIFLLAGVSSLEHGELHIQSDTIDRCLFEAASVDPIKIYECSDKRRKLGNTRSLHFTMAEYTYDGELFYTLPFERKLSIIKQKVSKHFANRLEKQYSVMHEGRGCDASMKKFSPFCNPETKQYWFGFQISMYPDPCPGNVVHFWLDCIGWYDTLDDSDFFRNRKTCDDIMATFTLQRLEQMDKYALEVDDQNTKFESVN